MTGYPKVGNSEHRQFSESIFVCEDIDLMAYTNKRSSSSGCSSRLPAVKRDCVVRVSPNHTAHVHLIIQTTVFNCIIIYISLKHKLLNLSNPAGLICSVYYYRSVVGTPGFCHIIII